LTVTLPHSWRAGANSRKWHVKGAVELIVGVQEGLDPSPEVHIAGALCVEHGGTLFRVMTVRSRQEHSLHTLWVGHHEILFRSG
jgi:hypothetical protein